jgi:hypothetical protein
MPQKGFSLTHQNKNLKIQTLICQGESGAEIVAGALFQTMVVKDTRRHRTWSIEQRVKRQNSKSRI